MVKFKESRIFSALILALVWASGYLVGFASQRAQTPVEAETTAAGTMNEAAVGPVISDSKADKVTSPQSFVDASPNSVLVHGASVFIVDTGGVLDPPPKSVTTVNTTTRSQDPVLISAAPDSASAVILVPSEGVWY